MMITLMKDVVTPKARQLANAVWRAHDQGKYLSAHSLIKELKLQIEADAKEHEARQQRRKSKKVLNLQNKEAKRIENRQRAKARQR